MGDDAGVERIRGQRAHMPRRRRIGSYGCQRLISRLFGMWLGAEIPVTENLVFRELFGPRDNSTCCALGESNTVTIKSAPGHTPGHQVLYLKLPKTGGVMLSGDLYHYPEERKLDRVPTFDFNEDQTRASRVMIETLLKKTGAHLWIQHDIIGNAKLKKSPKFYD
jgi:glyoxylase-like metal-dependent hydrolase (beta-lactamase superfamily II)